MFPTFLVLYCSFGHAILEFMAEDKAVWSWYRNQDGVAVAAERVELAQISSANCSNRR